jgi:hypothetical protein
MIVECAHASLEFLDSRPEKQHDVHQIFQRASKNGLAWVTGTEAASGGGPLAQMIQDEAKKHGFKPWVPSLNTINTDCWVAVNRDFMQKGSFRRDYIPVVPSSESYYRERGIDPAGRARWAARGLTIVTFENPDLGEFNIAAGHYIVKAADLQHLNRKIADTAAQWALDVAKGTGLAFYAGDQNFNDETEDTFFGEPFTSLWDELGKHDDTGHGTYDVIASYDRDRRVRGAYVRALKDARFPLFSDHFFVEAGFEIGRIRP